LRRITKAALGGVAGCAMIIGATQAANGEPPLEFYSPEARIVIMKSSAFDSAEVTLDIKEAPEATNFKIRVENIVKSETNPVHGAHLHNGPCPDPEGGPDTTLGHYKDDPFAAATPENEVWFDLETNVFGVATVSTTVPFVPLDKPIITPQDPLPDDPNPGDMSIVIHEQSAATPTSSSPKLVCFPLEVTVAPSWI
jgi:Cu/Zn superoxide dismutase